MLLLDGDWKERIQAWLLEGDDPDVVVGRRLEGIDLDAVAGWRLEGMDLNTIAGKGSKRICWKRVIQMLLLDGDWNGWIWTLLLEGNDDPDVVARWRLEGDPDAVVGRG